MEALKETFRVKSRGRRLNHTPERHFELIERTRDKGKGYFNRSQEEIINNSLLRDNKKLDTNSKLNLNVTNFVKPGSYRKSIRKLKEDSFLSLKQRLEILK